MDIAFPDRGFNLGFGGLDYRSGFLVVASLEEVPGKVIVDAQRITDRKSVV
jgi:hypothetical protein